MHQFTNGGRKIMDRQKPRILGFLVLLRRYLKPTMLAAAATCVLAASIVTFGQSPGGGGGMPVGGGGGELPAGDPISVSPKKDLAVGEVATLSVPSYAGASYAWRAKCMAGEVWRTKPDWDTALISNCVGTVGAQKYEVEVQSAGAHTLSSTTVNFHAPNYDVREGFGVNSDGEPPLMTVDLCFKQIWKDPVTGLNRPTGSCFVAYAQERIVTRDEFGEVDFDSGWTPTPPTLNLNLFFDSPCIKDRKIYSGTIEEWNAKPVGDVFHKIEQEVRLTTSKCEGTELILTSVVFKLQFRKVSATAFVVELQP